MLLLLSLSLIADLIQMGGHPQILEKDSVYEKIALTDSTTLEVYKGDSILVVFTACAPQCSSCARVYNKEWQLIQTVTPPFSSIFPLATIENGRIVWKDNDTWNYQSTL
ncbi:MAG: hypothetical protein IKO66_05960 [Paludibacteraceae bacterium]|nr:hypothetical protein [Paludibacteraceae bacterium]